MSAEVYARGLWIKDDCVILKDGDLTIQMRRLPKGVLGVTELDFGEVELDVNAYPPEIRETDGARRHEMERAQVLALKDRIVMLHAMVGAAVQNMLKGLPT